MEIKMRFTLDLPPEVEGELVKVIRIPLDMTSIVRDIDGYDRKVIELKPIGHLDSIWIPPFGISNKGYVIPRRSLEMPVEPKPEWLYEHIKGCGDAARKDAQEKGILIKNRVLVHIVLAEDFFPEVGMCSVYDKEMEHYLTLYGTPINEVQEEYFREIRRI